MGHGSYNPLGKVSASGAGRTKDDLWSMHLITRSTRWGIKIHHPLLRPFLRLIMPSPPPSITTRISIWSGHATIKREHSVPEIGLGDTLLLELKDGILYGATRGSSKHAYTSRRIPADCDVKIDVTKISDISDNKIPGKTTYTLQEDEFALFEERETGLEFVEEKGRELKVRPLTVYQGGEGWDEGGESTDEALSALTEKPPPSQSHDG